MMNCVSDNLFLIMDNPADIIINLGMEHQDGKVNQYWGDWLEYCYHLEHPLYGWYIWDQGSGFPGDYHGRLARSHEFLFHFSNGHADANKWIETTGESLRRGISGKRFRQKDGSLKELVAPIPLGNYLRFQIV